VVSKHRLTDIIIVKECFDLLNTLANSPFIGAEMQTEMLLTEYVSKIFLFGG
jgi:hypothetical protein